MREELLSGVTFAFEFTKNVFKLFVLQKNSRNYKVTYSKKCEFCTLGNILHVLLHKEKHHKPNSKKNKSSCFLSSQFFHDERCCNSASLGVGLNICLQNFLNLAMTAMFYLFLDQGEAEALWVKILIWYYWTSKVLVQ